MSESSESSFGGGSSYSSRESRERTPLEEIDLLIEKLEFYIEMDNEEIKICEDDLKRATQKKKRNEDALKLAKQQKEILLGQSGPEK